MDRPDLPKGTKPFQLGQAPETMPCDQAQEVMARAGDENEEIDPDLLARAVDHTMFCSACGEVLVKSK